MRVYVREHAVNEKSALVDRLHPGLIRSIAITELMLKDPPWIEPPQIDSFDLSTLTHQILSVLAETGGCQANQVFSRLCSRGAFRAIDSHLFSTVIRSLGANEVVEQMEQGDLILAPKGEALVNHYSFYSAFASAIDYSVVYGSALIGTLPAIFLPQLNDHFLLGGRRWQVESVDDDRKQITVRPAHGKKPPMFFGAGGEIHPRVRQMMREVVLDDRQFRYLNATAAQLLSNARATALQAGLGQGSFITLSPNKCIWFTWTGTKIQRTLCLIADSIGLRAVDRDIAIEFDDGLPVVVQKLQQAMERSIDPFSLAARLPAKQTRKLDYLLADPLLIRSLAYDAIDIKGAKDSFFGIKCTNKGSRDYDLIYAVQNEKEAAGGSYTQSFRGPTVEFINSIEVQYVNYRGEEKTFTADRNSILVRKAHFTMAVAPTGRRITLNPEKIVNRSEVEAAVSRQGGDGNS